MEGRQIVIRMRTENWIWNMARWKLLWLCIQWFCGQIVKESFMKGCEGEESKTVKQLLQGLLAMRSREMELQQKKQGSLGFVCVYMFCWVQILESICMPVETVYWEREKLIDVRAIVSSSAAEKTGSRAEVKDWPYTEQGQCVHYKEKMLADRYTYRQSGRFGGETVNSLLIASVCFSKIRGMSHRFD